MSEEKDCVVKLVDHHGVEHTVKVRAQSVYEATLKGLSRLERVGWEGDGSQVAWVVVEIWEEPTVMPRPKKPEFEFSPEQRAVWRAMPKLTLCPKYQKRRIGFHKVLEHIERDNCWQCRKFYAQIEYEKAMVLYLTTSRN
jgi:hypothetical protein